MWRLYPARITTRFVLQSRNKPLHISSPLSKYHPSIHLSQVVASSHTRQLCIHAAEECRDNVSLKSLFFLSGQKFFSEHFRIMLLSLFLSQFFSSWKKNHSVSASDDFADNSQVTRVLMPPKWSQCFTLDQLTTFLLRLYFETLYYANTRVYIFFLFSR